MSMSHDVSTSRPVTYHREMTSLSELYDTDLDDDEHKGKCLRIVYFSLYFPRVDENKFV